MRGFAALPLVIILVALAMVGGGIFLLSNKLYTEVKTNSNPTSSVEIPIATSVPSASASATPSPTIKPTIAPTKKPTPVPTVKPTVTPAPTQAAGPSCPSSDQKADLVVNIQKSEGVLTGETTITLICGGTVQKTQVIPNNGRSVTFYGYSVGSYKVKASNSGKNLEYDLDLKPGNPPLNFNFPE